MAKARQTVRVIRRITTTRTRVRKANKQLRCPVCGKFMSR